MKDPIIEVTEILKKDKKGEELLRRVAIIDLNAYSEAITAAWREAEMKTRLKYGMFPSELDLKAIDTKGLINDYLERTLFSHLRNVIMSKLPDDIKAILKTQSNKIERKNQRW